MTVDFDKLQKIFLAAVEGHRPEAWDDFVDQACADDPELGRQVKLLLQAHQEAGSLRGPADQDPHRTEAGRPRTAASGSTIGPYKLVEEIGEGGMGNVWMAQQTEPIKRLVAVKLIKAGMDSKQVIARFEAERQALALMDHPNIAKVLDGGTTKNEPGGVGPGCPYFVMELVKGVPITKYCDDQHLTPRQRLELFIPVCQAVQHAHQKGIIHRDLKPSNVLVTLYDGRPVPKVIDFGVAKAVGQPLTEHTLVTGFGAIVGTLEYMSPEQAEINQLDIDTRSDIYALGVLLYELLTGTTPFSRKDLGKAGVLEMLRLIREQEPSRPSLKLSTAEGLPTLAANRGTEPGRLAKLVRGELDWIVMKALAKERDRRYETANGFAMDLQRYLADEPVQACPPSVGYRFRKFARRRKTALTAGILVALSLLVGTFVSLRQAARAIEAERAAQEKHKLAEANFDQARQAVNESFTIISDAKLLDAPGLQPLRQELLEAALRYYRDMAARRGDDPAVLADMAAAELRVGLIQHSLDRNDEMVAAFRAALPLIERLRSDFPDAVEHHRRLAGVFRSARIVSGTRRPRDPAAALRALTRSLELWTAFDEDNPGVDGFRGDIAFLRYGLGIFEGASGTAADKAGVARAVAHFRASASILEDLRRVHPTDKQYLYLSAQVQADLGWHLQRLGDRAGGQLALDRSKELKDELQVRFPGDFLNLPQPGRQLYKSALALSGTENEKAERRHREAIREFEKLIKDYPAVPEYQFDLALAHINRGLLLDTVMRRPDEAKAAYEKGFGLLEKTAANFPQDRMIRARIASNIRSVAGYLARDPKRYLDADGLRLRDVAMHESMARDFPDDPRWPEQVVHGHRLRGSAFLDAGHPREATAAFADAVRALERWSTRFPPALHKHLLDETRTYLAGAKARHAWGLITHPDPKARRPEEALTLAQDAVESAPREGLTWKALGMAYFRLRRWQEAAEALAKADRLGPDLNQTFSPFIRAMADWMLGKHEAARKWYDVGAVWLLRTNPSDAIQLAFRKEAAAMLGVSENATARQKQAAMDYWGRYVTLVIEADPQATWAFRERGLGHGKNGNWKEAVPDFRQAVRLDPDHVLTHCHLGQALARSGRVDEAVAAFREALRLENSGKVRWQILRPALMLAIEAAPGKYDPALAVDLANQIVVLTPTHTAAWTALGIAHYRANNWKEAITALEKSWQTRIEKGRTQNIPDLTSFCTNFFLAMAQSKSGNMVEARKAYDLAVAMMDNLPYRDRELVRLCTEAQAVLHLKPELQEAVRRDPNSAKAHFELGRLLQGESAWLDAAKHYQKAIELQSAAYPTARGELISSLLNAARTNPSEEVVAAYRKASAIIPGYSTLHFDLGRAHARLGRWKEAAEAYARGLEIDPGNIRAWYYGVPLHLRAGDVEGYRKLCAKMLQRFGSTSDPVHAEWTAVTCSLAPDAVADPNRLAALGDVAVTGTENRPYRNFLERAKGLAELRAGRLAEAEKWLERSDPETHGGPEDAAIFAALGIARLRSGKHEEAAAALAAAKAMLKTRKMPDPTQGNWVDLWPDWLHAEILVREAENLLNKK